MSTRCFAIEELDELLELPDGDSRLAHLDECPRCSTLLACYREFLDPHRAPAAEKAQAFREQFAAALEQADWNAVAGCPRPAERRQSGAEGALARLGRLLTLPALRPVYAVAATVLLVVVMRPVWSPPGGPDRADRAVLRGAAPTAGAFVTAAPEIAGDGSLRLVWQPRTGADGYVVVFTAEDLSEVARLSAGAEPFLVIGADSLRALAGGRTKLIWRVTALKGGDAIEVSNTRTVTLAPER